MHSRTVTVTTPTDTEIVMSRVFDAPRRLVFAAWTEPELLKRWYGARGWNLVVCEVDLRVGGHWRFIWRGPDGEDMGARGAYREIVGPDRLLYTEEFDEHWYPGEALVLHVLTESAGKTTLTTTIRYESREVRDLVVASPMDKGVAEGYDRLDEVLASVSAGGESNHSQGES